MDLRIISRYYKIVLDRCLCPSVTPQWGPGRLFLAQVTKATRSSVKCLPMSCGITICETHRPSGRHAYRLEWKDQIFKIDSSFKNCFWVPQGHCHKYAQPVFFIRSSIENIWWQYVGKIQSPHIHIMQQQPMWIEPFYNGCSSRVNHIKNSITSIYTGCLTKKSLFKSLCNTCICNFIHKQ